ncbi:hypothetical protein PF002_g21540 [Phytophthora fragariae]|uniref:Pectinesterase n=2 Tax=Phytophthora fragariae TaxID=53985 RepID=A0A6A3XG31_9STRA|nr:hypothetical protein PF007_g24023 [Phytophthora fragariae]KAE9201411.1 hypothetical protein PF002_g21540 [Phytophthora fragariae]
MVFVRPGVYHEQVLISRLASPLVLQGYTCDAKNYASNQVTIGCGRFSRDRPICTRKSAPAVTITQAKSQKDIPASVTDGAARNDMTSTVRFKSDNVKVYNLNIANTVSNGGQALTVSVNATDYGFYACNPTGYQDTVLADKGRELDAKTYIIGATDFVFGRYAQAWFESCDIETIGAGYITASGREAANSSATYVFNRARVFGKSGVNSTSLGRPWRQYAKVIWQNSELGDVVKPEGWSAWDVTFSTAGLVFKEFNNSGPGTVKGSRVAFSGQLDKPVAITEVLGERYTKEWFVDTSYL